MVHVAGVKKNVSIDLSTSSVCVYGNLQILAFQAFPTKLLQYYVQNYIIDKFVQGEYFAS